MTQNLFYHSPRHCNVNLKSDRPNRPRLRADADSTLRDIAFVLKMTQRVRDQIESEEEVHVSVSDKGERITPC